MSVCLSVKSHLTSGVCVLHVYLILVSDQNQLSHKESQTLWIGIQKKLLLLVSLYMYSYILFIHIYIYTCRLHASSVVHEFACNIRPVRRLLKRYIGYILVGTGFACASAPGRGVWGYAPPGKFWISRPSEIISDAILE